MYNVICKTCKKNRTVKGKQNISILCPSCRAKKRIKLFGNPMKGKKQIGSKFRNTYANVDYTNYKLNINNKRLYKMTCITCGADRGYKIHNEATRSCLKCHTLKQTKKTPGQKKIYNCMKANINSRFKQRNLIKQEGIFRHLPYTIHDLVRHLESQFEPWMNWENHGTYEKDRKTWQIDHIIADANFNYCSTEDEDFKKSWALSNLRPLESMANIIKSNK